MANYREIAFDIDFTSKKALNNQDIILEELTQNDHNSSILTLRLLQDEQPIDLTGMTVALNFLLPDGSDHRVDIAQSHNINTRTSLVMYYLPKEILSQVGIVVGTVSLYKAGYRYTSIVQFKFEVVEDIVVDGDIVDSEKYPILVSMINNINMIHEDEAKRVKAEESRVNAELERIEAEEERETTEATRALSELERQEAEEVRMVSEANRESMELERQKAEALRVASISEIESNELSRIEAEELRIQEEGLRKSVESSRVEAENVRQSQETVRQQKETERQTAEQSRKDSESQRENNESVRVANEMKRVEVELSRVQSESDRSSAELKRIEAENVRIQNNEQYAEAETVRSEQEVVRQQNEEDRMSAEEVRVLGESKRISAEAERQNSESARVQAEANREAKQNEFNTRAEEVAVRIEEEAQRINELVTLKEDERVKPNDMMDYMGNKHESLKDKADSDVEYILGEVNTVHYEGQTITATDTIERQVRSAILMGQTLVNLMKAIHGNGNVNAQYRDTVSIKRELLKPSTKYIIYAFNDGEEDVELYWNNSANFNWKRFICKSKAVSWSVGSSKDELTDNDLMCSVQTSQNLPQSLRCVILEYAEGMENWDIPYFEGMQSVRMPVLTAVGNNILNTSEFYNIENHVIGVPQTISGYERGIEYKLEPNTQYTLSRESNIALSSNLCVINSLGSRQSLTGGTKTSVSVITGSDGLLWLSIFSVNESKLNSLKNEVGWLQLEKGTQTPYDPYKSNILTVDGEYGSVGGIEDIIDLTISKATIKTRQTTVTSENVKYNWSNDTHTCFYISQNDMINGYGETVKSNLFLSGNINEVGSKELVTSDGTKNIMFSILNTRLSSNDLTGVIKFLEANELNVRYLLAQESIKTVDLNNQKVYSYDGTTHYTCSSEDGSLIPTLSIDVPTNLPALVSRQRNTIQELEKENEVLKEEVSVVDQQRENGDVELLGYNFDLDFRLLEIECALDLPMVLNTKNIKGANDMNTYKTAKTLILAGNYEREDMEYKLSVYLKRGRLTQDEYDELIALMDARELVE